jgi:hypothetical protein
MLRVYEYACHEGNDYAVTNILSGARADERAAAGKRSRHGPRVKGVGLIDSSSL